MVKIFDSTKEKEDTEDKFSLKAGDMKTETAKPLFEKEETKIPDIKDLVLEGRQEISGYEGIKEAPLPLSEISSSEVKEFLRERIGNLTIEGTIHEMYITIKSMETQIRKVLDINASLENDLKVTKETLISVNKDNEALKNKLKKMEDEGPLKVELERELRQLISEHNKGQEDAQDIMDEKDGMGIKNKILKQDITRLGEEREDALKDALFLQSKLDDMILKIKDNEEQINGIKGENLYFKEKITKQQEEISGLAEEKNAIELEMKESKEAFDEIYEALVETKIKTKKFFYQELKGE